MNSTFKLFRHPNLEEKRKWRVKFAEMSDRFPVSSKSYPGAGRVMDRGGDCERKYRGPQLGIGSEVSLIQGLE